ncbi:MAG: alpha/beta fold hydrolase [Rubrivivax sp.]|nr:alpha/beta fold hydrolase [Rubrivivax sp.]
MALPVLLLLHGLLNDERVWEPVAAQLRGDADIRIPNLRRQHSIARMARDAWAAVADVPPEVPVVLAGFSMGGYVAIQMLAEPARRAAALALVDTSTRPEAAENLPVREATMVGLQRDLQAETLAILRRGLHPAHLDDAGLVATALRIMRDVGADAATGQLRAIIGRADHRALLARLDLPTLVLCGRSDQVTPLALSQEAAALIPGARLEVVDEAGHWTPLEQPQIVADALRRLLAAL